MRLLWLAHSNVDHPVLFLWFFRPVSMCEKSVSTFCCPSLSQTSTVGKVFSVKLFHKLSKNTASRNLPRKVLFKLKTTKLLQLSAKHFQASKNSKQNSKSTNKVQSTSAILYFWINSVHGKQKAFKTKYLVVHSSK